MSITASAGSGLRARPERGMAGFIDPARGDIVVSPRAGRVAGGLLRTARRRYSGIDARVHCEDRVKIAASEADLKKRVLIVDDEPDIVEFVQYNLRKEMYDTLSAADGPRAVQLARQHKPDLVLLDIMLPGLDGIEVCRSLKGHRDTAHIPIIMLTAKGEEADVVAGLEVGADDYVSKPFSMRLLLARMKAVMRRTTGDEEPAGQVTRIHDLVVDDERHVASLHGEPLQLTLTEYKLLRFLARHPGRVFTRTRILDNIQDQQAIVIDRAIDVHVAALRKKLGEAGRYIETVRGVGYRFKE